MAQPNRSTAHTPKSWQSLVINFALPLFILTKLSSDKYLGATGALMAALAIPIIYELFGIFKRRKVQLISLVAIGGILVTGVIGLLGLNENWLAVRRSIVYFIGVLVILFCLIRRISVSELILKQAVNWQEIQSATKKNANQEILQKQLRMSDLVLMILLALVTIASYALTKYIITAPAGSAEFNQQYAELRVLSLAAVTGPLIIGLVINITYVLIKIEKLSGLATEHITTKRK